MLTAPAHFCPFLPIALLPLYCTVFLWALDWPAYAPETFSAGAALWLYLAGYSSIALCGRAYTPDIVPVHRLLRGMIA